MRRDIVIFGVGMLALALFWVVVSVDERRRVYAGYQPPRRRGMRVDAWPHLHEVRW